ncbi:MAG: hypothetical protein LQ347_005261 [Umbilicaria vellea]|nr:MAG: hypothetical protein LQ347_005261 [Umbilicaria vellea]
MRRLHVLLLLSTAGSYVIAADAPRPRGVGPESTVAKFYKATNSFTCISNPAIHISVSQVNDDYCDCPDGSDEPGTSACSHLSPLSPSSPSDISISDVNTTLALPGFYCKNKGHQGNYIPFLTVNDGVCDYDLCCDGSDEWARVGGTTCEDKCKEIGKEWRKVEEQRNKALGAASRKRKELVVESARLRKEVEDAITDIQTQIGAQEVKVRNLEGQLAEVERKERGKVVRAPAQGSRASVLAGLAKGRVEELREFLLDVRKQRDAGRERVKELEAILSTFKEEYNPNFNDEGVKRAVRSWEEYAARDKPADGDAAHDRDLDEIVKPDSETGTIQWEEWERPDDESDVEVLYKFEEYLPKPVRDWVDQKLRDLRILLIENGILAAAGASDTEPKAVVDARNSLKSAEDELNGSKDTLTRHKEDLEKDYGADDVFRALKGRCVSKDSGEYTYELCWFERTKQKPKKGGGDTGMGTFVRLDSITVDEEMPPDGKGLGSGRRVALRYENGQHCWNGPNRSTMVVLGCAETDEIWKIVEEEKCVYRMEVGTPAACEGAGNGKVGEGVRDEL